MMLYIRRPLWASVSTAVAVGDYAVCTGTTGADVDLLIPFGPTIPQNGAFKAVTAIRFGDFSDGMTNTLLIGEKHVPPATSGKYPNDCGIFDGHHPACSQRAAGPDFPLAVNDFDLNWRFGSPHPGICQFLFCDGTVRPISTSIDPYILGLYSQRNDGQAVPEF